jgi:hexosaminidase
VLGAAGVTVEVADASRASLGDEGYELVVSPARAVLRAGTAAGAFYGAQTLRQLDARPGARLATGTIRDVPRYAWRGLMVDVARHFFPLEELKRIVEVMGRYKLNRLHLHLTDDQGWRLELATRPALTAVGGATQVGGGPGGFFTRAEYAELVAFAAERFIVLVPELDLPGHTHAALASLPELNCDGMAPPPYTGTMVGFSSLCASKPQTAAFIRDVLGEVASLTPGPWIHLGGDEAKLTPLADYRAMVELARGVIEASGKQALGWEEVARADAGAGMVVQHWLDARLAAAAAGNGARLVVSPAKHAYLDMQYALNVPSPTVGTFWAGFVDVRDAYEWDPDAVVTGAPASAVLGVEAAVWTETIATPTELQTMLFPRLLATAELAWSAASAHDTRDFLRRLSAQGAGLEDAGVAFFPSSQVRWP